MSIPLPPAQTAIQTSQAPAALGPYSQAIKAGDVLYVSGQLGLNPKTMQFDDSSCVATQTVQALENLSAIIKEAGATLGHVVSTTILLTDMGHFEAVNEKYAQYFDPSGPTPPPARACFAVKALPKNALVEITAIVHLK